MSVQQVRYFHAFGFLKIPGLFADDIGAIRSAFDEVVANEATYRVTSSDVKVHGYRPRTTIPWFVDQHPTLAALRDDPRTLGVAKSLLSYDIPPSIRLIVPVRPASLGRPWQ